MDKDSSGCDFTVGCLILFWGCVAVIVATVIYILVHPEVIHG